MKYLKNVLKGIAVGISMMVPGVSGGTMAIVLGIYDKLVHSVATFFKNWRKNVPFLLQVGLGGVIGVLIFSRLMEGAMTSYPHIMRFIIMGIIIGGLPLLWRKASEEASCGLVGGSGVSDRSSGVSDRSSGVSDRSSGVSDRSSGVSDRSSGVSDRSSGVSDRSSGVSGGKGFAWGKSARADGKGAVGDYMFLLLGIAIVLLMSLEPERLINTATDGSLLSYIFLLIAGFVIAIGLVLPGISWSFMLLVMGMYETTLNAINTLNIPFLIPLGIGVALGTFGTARIIEKFLQKHPRRTYMLIIGFVVGSLWEVYPGIPTGWQLPVSLAVFLLGFAMMFIVGKRGLAD